MRIWLSAAALAAGAVLFAASALARPEANRGGTLRVLLDSDIDYVDPALAYYLPTWQIEYATCLKLLNFPDAGGRRTTQLVPEAAAGVPRISRDGRTYEFDVRAGFTRFSSGELVTAWNFKVAIERLASNRMHSPARRFVADIVGAEAAIQGRAPSVSGVRVVGSRLRITLVRRAGDFLARLAMPFFCAVPKATAFSPDGVGEIAAAGPYYIASWRPRRSIVLRRNPYYRGSRPQRLGAVVYRIGIGGNEAFDRIERGQADWVPGGGLPTRFASSPFGRTNTAMAIRHLLFNTDRGRPFSNPHLRKAAALALDRTEIAAASGPKRAIPFDHFLPPTTPGHRDQRVFPLTTTPAALEQARRLAAPYVPVTVTLNAFRATRGEAQVVARNLARVGINVEIKSCYSPTPTGKVLCYGFDSYIDTAYGAIGDPAEFLSQVLTDEYLRVRFADPRWIRRLVRAHRLESDRLDALGRLDTQIARDAVPAAALSIGTSRELFSARVGCFRFHRVYHVDLAGLCLRR